MSQSSTQSRNFNRRVGSLENGHSGSRTPSHMRKKSVSYNDAYLYALRVAYLSYLLQPRIKRSRYVATHRPVVSRTTTATSFGDMMKEFSLVRDTKKTRLPRDFIRELEKRLTGVLMGRERKQEFQDPAVKRSFAVFLNQLSEQGFRSRMENDRRSEELVLIFVSKATSELQKGKPPGDESVKRMVDRHVALFVRLLSIILKDHDWARERPELASKLSTLETKLLRHDENLASLDGDANGSLVEEIVPLSYEVKDMPMVQVVAHLFGLRNSMVQSDITKHKSVWTENTALKDLKVYQLNLERGTKRTLNSNDFDTHDAFESWKKAEAPELSQMMAAILSANPELAKSSTTGDLSRFHSLPTSPTSDAAYAAISKSLSGDISSPLFDQPVDMSSLNLGEHTDAELNEDEQHVYTFIPPDPRGMFRFILATAISQHIKDHASDVAADAPTPHLPSLLSKASAELLNEIAFRWRLPKFSRTAIFLDTIGEKFVHQLIGLETLDMAFNFAKEPDADVVKGKRTSIAIASTLDDRSMWTMADYALMQQLLGAIYNALLRDLYQEMMQCYDVKPPPLLGAIFAVLDDHVRSDPNYIQTPDEFNRFRSQVSEGLASKAREIYGSYVDKEIPQDQQAWEFYHVQQLGKSVLKLAERVQKRYRKKPELLGVNPLMILVANMLPAFGEDAKALVDGVIAAAKESGQEVPIQDGFDLYKELSEFRQVHGDALPNVPFAIDIEGTLEEFVWRWVHTTEQQIKGWVENAIKLDPFAVRASDPSQEPADDERHSVSVTDIFRSYTQIIDQMVQLRWDDDLGYAKFMTALSKSMGDGISRYCEIMEQMFSKEMDRLTPEQEIAASQTRQEKWMQLAKDTWNNKERVEPFQFYAQSFVKLNNIAFAIRHWDKLEREVNVDACAEVIKKNKPPAELRQKKMSKYVFTIKIVEGEDLKACDVSGYSDPYVVLTDEFQKRLSKTRIVYQNLNPRWDESVDIVTQGPLNIIATIWDWDAIGDHDYVGRTSLKLDPGHFGDFLPREYWLDLDTQGRLLVRVTMEGERDDIQFYFGKAFRVLQRTEKDMTRKITDKLSAYINHSLSRRALRAVLSKGISMATVSSFLNRSRISSGTVTAHPTTDDDISNALKPLFAYFNDNFAIMQQTLTSVTMITVMTRLWKEVLVTIEALLVPPLSEKPSQQKPLSQQELDVVFKWLKELFDFFHAVDENTGEVTGVPTNVLQSPKYFEIRSANFFYFEATENLIRESERMASANAASQLAARTRLSAPPALGPSFGGGLVSSGVPSSRRAKSIMLSRNLGTIKKAKEEKWKQAQAEPSDDVILRILRMRPEALRYLQDRSRQKERLAAAAVAAMIVKKSLLQSSGGRMTGPSVVEMRKAE